MANGLSFSARRVAYRIGRSRRRTAFRPFLNGLLPQINGMRRCTNIMFLSLLNRKYCRSRSKAIITDLKSLVHRYGGPRCASSAPVVSEKTEVMLGIWRSDVLLAGLFRLKINNDRFSRVKTLRYTCHVLKSDLFLFILKILPGNRPTGGGLVKRNREEP
jgi:hypothetical protein